MTQREAQLRTVEELARQSYEYSKKSKDALVKLLAKAVATTNVVISELSDMAYVDWSIASLNNERILALKYEKENIDAIRQFSFGLVESLHILLEIKGITNGDHNQLLTDQIPNSSLTSAESKEELINAKLQTIEEWQRKSYECSTKVRDILISLFVKSFETIFVVLSNTSDNECIEISIASLNDQRILAMKYEKNDDILRHLAFGLIESLQILLEMKVKNNGEQNQALVDEAPNSLLTIVEPKEESIDPIDQILEGNQLPIGDDFLGELLFKEEEIDFNIGADNSTLPNENSMNELPPNDKDAHANMAPSEVMGDYVDSMEDPTIINHNETSTEKESLNKSSEENMDDSFHNGMIGDANDLMGEKVEKDNVVLSTDDAEKDSSEADGVEIRKRPKRSSSKTVKYAESLDESEPLEKKQKVKSDKKIDNKRRSGTDESSSKSSTKGRLVTKDNHTELACPECEYRGRSVPAWISHLYKIHSTTPLKLGLALLCECGHESFSFTHSLQCDISRITIVRKNATPKCVMCEISPKTANGYARHLHEHHKTTLMQMRIYLICSCGYKVRSPQANPEHTKKCNGHDFTLHKMEDE